MRVPLLIAALLAISACGKNDQAGTSQNVDEGMTADSIVSNDVTAIDAVTGDAANMAADVDINFGNLGEDSSGDLNEVRPSKPTPSKPARTRTVPAAETNTTAANATANSE
jgi:hypothetical protein